MEFTNIKTYEAGIAPSAVADMVADWANKNICVHSFKLLRGGKCAAEAYWQPYKPEYVHMLNSLSKSFTATAVLFAIQEGLLTPDDKIVSFFPEKVANLTISEKMQKMTLRHLLSMCTGHNPSADFIFYSSDCVSAFLESDPEFEPGSRFSYNTAATFMLSAAVQSKAGVPIDEYLRVRLFDPLGMSRDIWWEKSDEGIAYGGFGLNVTTDDIARLGTLYLNRGMFDGKRIIDEKLIDEATRRHISNKGSTQTPWLDRASGTEDDIDRSSDWSMGYGWQFWRCIPDGVYRGDGAFGQFCIVMPKLDVVLAITAGTGDMQGILFSVWDKLLPGINADGAPVPSDTQAALDEMLASLRIEPATGDANIPDEYLGVTYDISVENLKGTVSFSKDGDMLTVTGVHDGVSEYKILAGCGKYYENKLNIDTGERSYTPPFHFMTVPDIAASWAWNKSTGLTVKCVLTRYAFVESAEITFSGDEIEIKTTMSIQVSDIVTLRGKRR